MFNNIYNLKIEYLQQILVQYYYVIKSSPNGRHFMINIKLISLDLNSHTKGS